MDISTFKKTSKNIPPNIAILIRAQTGVGKSYIVKQIGDSMNLPVIDVRGSTMSEGDLGYPDIEAMKKKGVMTFCMPSWFVRCCNEPVVLFLDELNRSLPAVQQAFFQIVLDRQLGNDEDGYPYNIHPETRIFSAINHGSEYDVNEMDPALLRRFWTIDLEPSFDDWKMWARENNVNEFIISFLNTRKSHFAPNPSSIEPGNVFPTPASWARLDQSIKYSEINLEEKRKENISFLFNLSQGFIGKETALDFVDYVKKFKIQIKPEDLLKSFDDCKSKLENSSNDAINSLIERLGEHAEKNNWNLEQSKNVYKICDLISEEMILHLWSCVSKSKNMVTIQNIHHYLGERLVNIINSNKDIINNQ